MEPGKKVTILDSWSSISEKTVFVLDRAPYFTHVSSGHSIEGDCMIDSKKTSALYESEPAIPPFDRSLWTCTVEAVVGYSRLVWDLFTPEQRSITILSVSPNNQALDTSSEPLFVEKITSWNEEDQNLDQLLKSLARKSHAHQIIPPQKLLNTTDISSYPNCEANSLAILNSLEQALVELTHLTSSQIQRRSFNRSHSLSSNNVENNGRIVLISSFRDEEAVAKILQQFELMLQRKNESLKEALKQQGDSSSANVSLINYCDLVIVNTFPINDIGPCSSVQNTSCFRPKLHTKVYSVKSGRSIAGLLNNICLQHYNLRSTTITGIPMKEEQNASSSSQYDVEIVHCSSIHQDIIDSDSPLLDGIVEVIDRNSFPCDTFKLNWCTPKTQQVDITHCVATSRITAVDVNSRPSTCLTNFLLNGRTVMLEIFKSKSNRTTTHLLTSHNRELFIHSLAISQQKLNLGDPPSIGDSPGGKVGDYRMNEFVNFMKQHTLTKMPQIEESLAKSRNHIKRQTLYWPLTLGHTILLNVPNLVGTLLKFIPKPKLNQSEVDECKKCIDGLIKHETDGQALPSVSILEVLKSISSKNSGTKLEQLYKLFWNELEYYLRVHSSTPEHEVVLDYLLDRNSDKKPESERGSKRPASSKAGPSPTKRAKMSSHLMLEITSTNPSVQETAMFYRTGMSLWQTWTSVNRHLTRHKNKLPFVGWTQAPTGH